MNTVVTFLWKDVQDFDKYEHPFIENKKWFKERGDVYDMSYVNKLFSSIRRNTTHPVECVLITDYVNTDTNADRYLCGVTIVNTVDVIVDLNFLINQCKILLQTGLHGLILMLS